MFAGDSLVGEGDEESLPVRLIRLQHPQLSEVLQERLHSSPVNGCVLNIDTAETLRETGTC